MIIIRRVTIKNIRNSQTYRVNIPQMNNGDTLEVHIAHESKDFNKVFLFTSEQLINRRSISFSVIDSLGNIDIFWNNIDINGDSKKIQSSSTINKKKEENWNVGCTILLLIVVVIIGFYVNEEKPKVKVIYHSLYNASYDEQINDIKRDIINSSVNQITIYGENMDSVATIIKEE